MESQHDGLEDDVPFHFGVIFSFQPIVFRASFFSLFLVPNLCSNAS